MATLNIKDFPDSLHERLRARAKRECRSVAQEVTYLLKDALEKPEPLDITQLKGLGKELWQGEGADAFLREEREAWDD